MFIPTCRLEKGLDTSQILISNYYVDEVSEQIQPKCKSPFCSMTWVFFYETVYGSQTLVRPKLCEAGPLDFLVSPRSVPSSATAATWEHAVNLIIDETNTHKKKPSFVYLHTHRAIRRVISIKWTESLTPTSSGVRRRSRCSCETHAGIHVPTFTEKSRSGDNLCLVSVETFFFLYLNSRQWHWSEGRHPVGERGDGVWRERGGFLLRRGCGDKWRREVAGSQVFNLSVTVNNLGRRRFIAPLSKCFRRGRVLWPSYWSNWEDVQQSGRNSSEPHRMHAVRKASGALLANGRPFKAVFSGQY